ncbi:MAG: hypothetical protein OEN56_16025 [Gemmatimonadota bacterium]|nr:hypothetical protein [Gemmatimonadota bacterium]
MVSPEERRTFGALTEFLFPAPAKRSTLSIIGWWEKRRLPYNLIVGSAGIVSLGISLFFAALPPFGSTPGIEILIPVTVFGVMANLCYFLGPTVEILIERIWGREVLPTGPTLYRMGLTFSVGLALLPALMMVILWVARTVFLLF